MGYKSTARLPGEALGGGLSVDKLKVVAVLQYG